MLQAILERPQEIVFREVEKPAAAKGQILMKVKRIGVCGSDIHAYYGKHPYISCPIVQGHEFSGQIMEIGACVGADVGACVGADVGAGVGNFKVGDKVTVMPQLTCGKCYPCTHGSYNICNTLKVIGCQETGAAQEYFAVDAKLAVRLPEAMSYDYGAMVEPVAVGVHAVSRLGCLKDAKGTAILTGMNILVLGAGPIGNLTAQAAKGLGAKSVMITDISDYRLDIAKKCRIDFTVNTSREDLDGEISRRYGDDRTDAMVECVGVQETIKQAVQLARKGTDIVVVGVFSSKPAVDMGLVQDKELRLIGSLMYKEADYHTAIELINSGKIHLDPLISKYFAFSEYPAAYKFIEESRGNTMKVIIDMDE